MGGHPGVCPKISLGRSVLDAIDDLVADDNKPGGGGGINILLHQHRDVYIVHEIHNRAEGRSGVNFDRAYAVAAVRRLQDHREAAELLNVAREKFAAWSKTENCSGQRQPRALENMVLMRDRGGIIANLA